MGTFSYTKTRKLSFGNRVAYQFNLVNVQTSGSRLHTPFKKITGYLIETTSPQTSTIAVATNSPTSGGNGSCATLIFKATAESQGEIIVVGLL